MDGWIDGWSTNPIDHVDGLPKVYREVWGLELLREAQWDELWSMTVFGVAYTVINDNGCWYCSDQDYTMDGQS